MKWCEIDKSRVSLLQSRRYPPVAAKNRRRHIVDQETKDRPATMHHQFHVGYNGVQGGTTSNAKSPALRAAVGDTDYVYTTLIRFNDERN